MRDLRRYSCVGPVRDNEGDLLPLYVPDADYVSEIVEKLLAGEAPFDVSLPVNGADVWNADNLGLVCILLSGAWHSQRGHKGAHVARHIADISRPALDELIAAYLSYLLLDGVALAFEQVGCDGSSFIPDLCEGGYWMKDPASVPHDHEWARHHAGDLPDSWGKRPSFHRSNERYRDILIGFGHAGLADEKFRGLEVLGRLRWNGTI